MKKCFALILFVGSSILSTSAGFAAERVTVDNFVRAETDSYMARFAAQGGFGKIVHTRGPTPVERQDVIRMNRDTLYSTGLFDLTHPLTIIKPSSDGRFQSMQVINQDHSTVLVEHGSGRFTFTKEQVGTRYVAILFRTFADPADHDDVKKANALQDQIKFEQKAKGTFEIPDWDEMSLKTVRDALNVLAATKPDASGAFGKREDLNPLDHLLGTAMGWGGNPQSAAMYTSEFPEENDGKTPYTLAVNDVPVDGFWSVTVYNAAGYMEKNEFGRYSLNNVTAAPNDDGSYTIHFGGEQGTVNFLPIMPGWNYTVRMYQPGKELLDGTWTFPKAEPVR